MSSRHRLRPEVPPDPRRSISLTEAERHALVGQAEGSADPIDFRPGVESMTEAETAGQVGEALLDALEPLCRHVVILRPSRGELQGWIGRGPLLDQTQLKSLSENLADDAALKDLADLPKAGYTSVEPSLGIARVASCWRSGPPATLLVVPVRVGARLVALALGEADAGPRAPVSHLDLLAEHAGRALGRMLARRRAGGD